MDFDFSAIMLLAVVVTGIIWAVDIAMLKPKRVAAGEALQGEGNSQAVVEQAYKEPVLVEYARSFFPVILAVLILRSFLIEPFRIPSGSMMPTLLSGDFILVNKYTYGIRLPVVNAKVIELGLPERGDVVVFRIRKIQRLITSSGWWVCLATPLPIMVNRSTSTVSRPNRNGLAVIFMPVKAST